MFGVEKTCSEKRECSEEWKCWEGLICFAHFHFCCSALSAVEKRAGPVSIKEINWPFSPPRTNAPTNPVSPRGTLACFFKQEDFILAGQQDFPLHPPGFLTAHQNYFLLPIRRIVSGKQVDFFDQGRRGDEGDSATSCCLLTADQPRGWEGLRW